MPCAIYAIYLNSSFLFFLALNKGFPFNKAQNFLLFFKTAFKSMQCAQETYETLFTE